MYGHDLTPRIQVVTRRRDNEAVLENRLAKGQSVDLLVVCRAIDRVVLHIYFAAVRRDAPGVLAFQQTQDHAPVDLDDHLPPGRGAIEFAALKPFLKDDTHKVIELKPGLAVPETKAGIRFIRELLSVW